MATATKETTTRAPELPDLASSEANIYQRVAAVMRDVGWIEKSGRGPEAQGGYAYARVETIKDACRDACLRHGLVIVTSIDGHEVTVLEGVNRDGRPLRSILATVWGTLSLVNVDNPGEVVRAEIRGQGLDQQDKAMSKATTSAIKYGLLNVFVIPTGDDPDGEGHDLPAGGQSRPQTAARTQNGSTRGPGPGDYAQAGNDPGPQEPSAPAVAARGPSQCPKHDRDWKLGQYGWFCSAKDDTTERGYCSNKPSREWVAQNER